MEYIRLFEPWLVEMLALFYIKHLSILVFPLFEIILSRITNSLEFAVMLCRGFARSHFRPEASAVVNPDWFKSADGSWAWTSIITFSRNPTSRLSPEFPASFTFDRDVWFETVSSDLLCSWPSIHHRRLLKKPLRVQIFRSGFSPREARHDEC